MYQRLPMTAPESFLGGDDTRPLLTVKEAALFLRIGRSLAYELANQYLMSGGTAGMPVIRFATCLRVPRWALMRVGNNRHRRAAWCRRSAS